MSHTPEWADFNESDPGISLLELLAFLGAALFFTAWAASLVRRWRCSDGG